jgi:hypothetical protein
MIEIPYNANYSEVRDRMQDGVSLPCIICGRPCKQPKHYLRIFWGSHIVTTQEAERIIKEEGSGGDLCYYPVGSNCLKNHPELQFYVDDAESAIEIPPAAGLKSTRRNRVTGKFVSVYDGELAGMDTFSGRWQVVCETHGTILSFETLALANFQASVPVEWCEQCRSFHENKLS